MINPFFDLERRLEKLLRLPLPIPSFLIDLLLDEWCRAHQQLSSIELEKLKGNDHFQDDELAEKLSLAEKRCWKISGWLRQIGRRTLEPACRRYTRSHTTADTNYHLASLFLKQLGHSLLINDFLDQAIALDPEHILAYRQLARLLLQQREESRTRASSLFQKVVAVLPKDWESRWYLAQLLVEQKAYEEAAPLYVEATDLMPDNAVILLEYAALLWPHLKDIETAVSLTLKVLDRDKNNKEIRQRLQALRQEPSLSQSSQEQIDQTLAAVRHSSALSKGSSLSMPDLWFQWRSHNQALMVLVGRRQSAIGSDGQWEIQAKINLQLLQLERTGGQLKRVQGQFPNKLKQYLSPELKNATSADDHYHLAVFLYHYYGFDYHAIINLCQKAVVLDPTHVFSHTLLAICLERYKSDLNLARHHYEAALEIAPDYFEARMLLAGLARVFVGDAAALKMHRDQILSRLQYRQQEVITLESARNAIAVACNALFNPEQEVATVNVQMMVGEIILSVVAQTYMLAGGVDQVKGDSIRSLIDDSLGQPFTQAVLVNFPRIHWPVDLIKSFIGFVAQIIEFTLKELNPGKEIPLGEVANIGHAITADLRLRARLFRSKSDHSRWFKAWWQQDTIPPEYQYEETGSWKGLMGGRYVTSSKHPGDWDPPW